MLFRSTFEGQPWLRRDHARNPTGETKYALMTTLVQDPAGDSLDLTHLEHKAYWT